MDKEKNDNKIEREYIIPLRREWSKVPRYKKANRAIKAIKKFLARHMKIRDRDLDKIKIDKYLNEEIWFRGIRKPPHKIKVKAVKDGEIVRVELFEFPDKLKFKKMREEKTEKKSAEAVETKHIHAPEQEIKTEEKPEEEKKEEVEEKKASVVEAGQKLEKEMSKKIKHQTKQSKQPKHQFRKALQK